MIIPVYNLYTILKIVSTWEHVLGADTEGKDAAEGTVVLLD